MKTRFFDNLYVHFVLIALLGLLAYSNTFDVPFQWDSEYLVAENPMVKDLGYFAFPSEGSVRGLEDYYSAMRHRYVGYLTFALNYWVHGTDVAGYHIFNLSVHILNALLVYLLVMLTFRTPFLETSGLREKARHIALFGSLLFVAHPVQTEAVTYIFQRLASLVTFFYLLSLLSYAGSRLSVERKAKYGLYVLSLVSAVLAMKTKENAFTLPPVILLYELLFFGGAVMPRVARLVPLLLTMLIVPLSVVGTERPIGEIAAGMASVPRGHAGVSRSEYLLTQFPVIATYIRLLFLPINQNIDYDYPVFGSLTEPRVLLSLLLLLALIGVAVCLYRRSRASDASLRLMSFGILWFFATLSVESSIIPIPMIIDEYRLYLPSVGALSALATGAFIVGAKLGKGRLRKASIVLFCLLPLVLAYAAHARNAVWKDKTALWEDVVRKSPRKERGYVNLGLAYYQAGLADKAIAAYARALKLNPGSEDARLNLGNAYLEENRFDEATLEYRTVLKLDPGNYMAHNNLGNVYSRLGLYHRAADEYRSALGLAPEEPSMRSALYLNLGNACFKLGRFAEAVAAYRAAIELEPADAEAHYLLGDAYLSAGAPEDALAEYERALGINPAHAGAIERIESLRGKNPAH